MTLPYIERVAPVLCGFAEGDYFDQVFAMEGDCPTDVTHKISITEFDQTRRHYCCRDHVLDVIALAIEDEARAIVIERVTCG